MEPKEKALELYNYYEQLARDFTRGVSIKEFAKLCALKAVDEILNAWPHTYDLEKEYLRGGGASVNVIKNIRPNMGYWRDVLIQINEIRGYDTTNDK